jgi:3-phenylpropionate/trans-cinnamate dioxygenase ferredoxin reductase subunit
MIETVAGDVLVIGAGQAAAQIASSLVSGGFTGRLRIIGDEPVAPYQRPPLSKDYLKGKTPLERLWFRNTAWYADRGIELITGDRVIALHREDKAASTAAGKSYPYDVAVLATGARARPLDVPGSTLPGVHQIRTLADIAALAPTLETTKRLVVAGAGFIGLEMAAVARGFGIEVIVLEAASRCLSRALSPQTAATLTEIHESHGVDFRFDTKVVSLVGTDRVTGALLDDGRELPCDAVVVGIGAIPNDELANESGLECDRGIVVDADGRTADPAVFAAGDCTNRPLDTERGRGRLESVHNAVEQGKVVAAAVLGQPRPRLDVPWFWSDQYETKLQIVGVLDNPDESVTRHDPETGEYAAFHLKNGVLQVVEAVNSPRSFMAGKRLIAGRAELDAVRLADPGFDLKQLLRAG